MIVLPYCVAALFAAAPPIKALLCCPCLVLCMARPMQQKRTLAYENLTLNYGPNLEHLRSMMHSLHYALRTAHLFTVICLNHAGPPAHCS